MKTATVIFPHQLFKKHPGLSKNRDIFLVEDQRFFGDPEFPFHFHKKKLILHRASMRAYRERLMSEGYYVHYVEFRPDPSIDHLFKGLRDRKADEIWVADPVDHVLEDRLRKNGTRWKIKVTFGPTPAFLSSSPWLADFFRTSTHFSMAPFYIAQRKRLGVLVEGGKPLGGKWSFDPENRKKIPKGLAIPPRTLPKPNKWTEDAANFVARSFPENPGTPDGFVYGVTHEDAEKWLDDFLKKCLRDFGDYQDAMVQDEPFLFHSVLTPMLNIGLLTPDQIVQRSLAFAQKNSIPLNDLEGFIRQVIGWREFMRAVYLLESERERRTNFFRHRRNLPRSFYTGTTGIGPVDTVIQRLTHHAYVHHIERLMILGNFMLLCEIHPDEVYRWFMELFIDAYDWVMVPNVYGMSQHADGGFITTKPYISSSHYIRKMSDFPEGDWCDTWDGLYWRFIFKHRDFFGKNPRMKVMTRQLDRMGKARLKKHLAVAEQFLGKL